MKNLRPERKILGMQIIHDREIKKLWLSQQQYLGKVLEKFNMAKEKPVNMPLASHFKLTINQCPSSIEEKSQMSKIPYASAVGILMYAMVCTRIDIAHSMGVVSRFLQI